MAVGKYSLKLHLPGRIEGWLNIWEVDHHQECRLFYDGIQPSPVWEAKFVVLQTDICSLTSHNTEESANHMRYQSYPRLRLDGGKEEFDKRWGYETLECIKENAIQHSPRASAESFFRSRTLELRNESLPDLSKSLDFDTGRGQTFFRKIFNTSFERLNERRGSAPLVSTGFVGEDMMDTPSSTSSKLASFFSKKGFRSNLKRTKSVTKLDRKRSASNVCENDTSLISSRIRTSRSHESLLTSPASMHSIDLSSPDIHIKPLHTSVLGHDHCFQVSTHHGSKYISCRTSEERDKWLDSLRKTVKPNQEHCRRTDNSLKLWLVEAKNVSSKKRYFCEIYLDKTLYARTSTKMKSEMLFWGEHFEFSNLPPVDVITVNLFREADRKKKKDKNTLLGYINIPIAEIGNRQYVEKWYTAMSGTVGKAGKDTKTDLPIIRLKARYQTVHILPLDLYSDFINFLQSDYCKLCEGLEPIVNVRDKEDIATTLIHIMQKLGLAQQFLSDVVMTEIYRLDNEHLTFRGNSLATKAMEAYMKLVGEKFLHDTIGDYVRNLIECHDDCEVDPTKVSNIATLQCHQKNLEMYCQMAWAKIMNSYCYFPSELREVFSSFRERCIDHGKEDISDNLISASIFLRFLCPAILSPSLFNLTQEYPQERAARNLTLIAKTIQTLANFTKFGGGKEEYMTFLNGFVERESNSMKTFLKQISSLDGGNQFLEFDGFIDMGREISILHSMLQENLDKASEESVKKLSKLKSILSQISAAIDDPTIGRTMKHNRKSQVYDNLVNVPSSHNATSPTKALRDLLEQCGEDLPIIQQLNRQSSQNDVLKESRDYSAKPVKLSSRFDSRSATYTPRSSEVSNVSARSRKIDEDLVNQSWNQMVSVADSVNNGGEYLDLIPFMDEDAQNSSMEMDHNTHGSQVSIGQLSTIASSGYQSFSYSQSNSPIDSNGQEDRTAHETSKSPPALGYTYPLQFSNPLYSHQLTSNSSSSCRRTLTPSSSTYQASSDSSINSADETSSVRQPNPIVKNDCGKSQNPLHQLSQLSSSSSSCESLTEQPVYGNSRSCSSSSSSVKFSMMQTGSSPAHSHSTPRMDRVLSRHRDTLPHDHSEGRSRPYHLSHSMDFGYLSKHNYSDTLRRASTDTLITQANNQSNRLRSGSSGSLCHSGEDNLSSSGSSRRLSPLSSVHMGISSVQRKLQEQEKTKIEYEQQVHVLRQQLADAQIVLEQAEARLSEHEETTHQVAREWQQRLQESEERMRLQQAEKDDQMKSIIHRLVLIEDELKKEQVEMQRVVSEKQAVIEAQERRITTVDAANAKLLQALNELKERYTTTQRNGILGSNRPKITSAELGGFKSSSC
ncbi:ras GTPase-activating protein nGAP isoform X4 [Patella vulgata]|uniref:ras GTPase-activating protein nGAP isoform X4 n=1 Tax=Patella vulgata TaxID=6465 RepID=UPI0021808549|nr:ras GTPase-activating protein nGAP isoform X4 [Patella vulgata]